MSDETMQTAPEPPPRRDYFNEPPPPPFKRMLSAIPPRVDEVPNDSAAADVAAAATAAALYRSEARRDAILAVALAIKRRGQNPMTDWTTRDTDTAFAIADQLIALG
jgi:hypothetical protein